MAIIGPGGKPHLDLHGLLKGQASDLGLDPLKDGSIKRCTLCERDTFYSYRGGDDGRQWGWAEILGGRAICETQKNGQLTMDN
jgi:copper oxidase (laccase) domain-containing protein